MTVPHRDALGGHLEAIPIESKTPGVLHYSIRDEIPTGDIGPMSPVVRLHRPHVTGPETVGRVESLGPVSEHDISCGATHGVRADISDTSADRFRSATFDLKSELAENGDR